MAGRDFYAPDYRGLGGVAESSEMSRFVQSVAEGGKGFAQSIAPVETGEYRDSFRVEPDTQNVAGARRAVALLVNDAPHAGIVEGAAHVLSRTVDHIEQNYG